ncbi:MAG: glycogen debranching N-terminal domain-containing protein, partial [Gemmatimonadaceae bacterium]
LNEARLLSSLQLEINGKAPWLCEAAQEDATRLTFSYIHPEMATFGGGGTGQARDERSRDENGLPHRSLEIQLRYDVVLNGLNVEATITNRWREQLEFDVTWHVDADFADIMDVATPPAAPAQPVSSGVTADGVRFASDMAGTGTGARPADAYESAISLSGGPGWRLTQSNRWLASRLRLTAQESCRLRLQVRGTDSLGEGDVAERERHWREWRGALARITTPGNTLAERIIARNVADLASLPLMHGERDEWLAMQAGIPLYPALFGRDALTAAWQAAMLDRGTALHSALTRLDRLQGTTDDPEREEEPGRMIQQVRLGPRARHTPFRRYYGDFASPFMYLIALAHLYAWQGDKRQLQAHWDTARRVLDWARQRGDRDGDGYLEYLTQSQVGPTHQGWKDSGDAILHADGALARAPVATCELQGYWYAAQQVMAVMSWALGERADATAHWDSARDLKERFNRDWWVAEEDLPALAMDAEKRLVRSPASNAGHCLACGILSDEHLPRTVGRLFAPDLFSGWGIRTLSSVHPAYDPLSYHNGSVWAVENATIAFGLRRFGFDARALDLAEGLFDLAGLYPHSRIPETVAGYARTERATPGAYPRANSPQLWNASAFPLLVHVLAGLQPVAPLELLVVDPVLPSWLPEIVIHDLRLAGATASLRFWRDKNGDSHAEVLRRRGTFHLVRQPSIESQSVGWRDRFSALADRVLHH